MEYLNHNQNQSYIVFSSELWKTISKIEMNTISYSIENDLNIDMKTLIIPSQVGYFWMFYVGDVSKKVFCTFPDSSWLKNDVIHQYLCKYLSIEWELEMSNVGKHLLAYQSGYYSLFMIEENFSKES